MKFSLTKPNFRKNDPCRGVILLLAIFVGFSPVLVQGDQVQTVGQQRQSFPIAAEREPARRMLVVATAYSSDVAQTDSSPCIPANGYNLCEHYKTYGSGNSIAANFLPLETQVRIPELFGDKVFIVRDRMNERYGYGRIDVWVPSRNEAKQFGVQYVEIELYGGGQWRYRLAER